MKNKVFLFMLVLVMGILAACGTSEKIHQLDLILIQNQLLKQKYYV